MPTRAVRLSSRRTASAETAAQPRTRPQSPANSQPHVATVTAPSGRIAATAENGHSYSPGAVNIQTENATFYSE